MSVFDVEELLKEIDPDNPAGNDLEYDPDFIAMESLASAGNEQSMIEAPTAAETHSADWQGVKTKALGLFDRTRDLRVAVYLVRSSLACDGLAGFAQGLLLLRNMLERFWEQVHPQLDIGDDNDPTMRANTIAMLCGKIETLDLLVSAPLIKSDKLGDFSFRDVQISTGDLHPGPEDKTPPTPALIDAAFLDCELEDLQRTAAAINDSLENVRAIDQLLTEYVGNSQGPNLQDLMKILIAMNKFATEQLSKRGVSMDKAGTEAAPATEPPTTTNAVAQAVTGEILSREAAVHMMEKISRYYTAHEPSSPIPLLMQRAKRLSSMDFMGILEDLAPSAMNQLQNIAGSAAGTKGSGSNGED